MEDALPSGELLIPAVYTRANLSFWLANTGEFDEAQTIGARALLVAERTAHAVSHQTALQSIGHMHLIRGDPGTAVAWFERARELSLDHDATTYSARGVWLLGYAYALDGRIEEGIELLQSGVQRHMEQVGRGFPLSFLGPIFLGEAYLLAGRLSDAATLSDDWLARYRAMNLRSLVAYALRLQGEVASHRGDHETAQSSYAEALTEADALGLHPLAARCHLGLGELLAATGQLGPAEIALRTAADMLCAMAMPYWLARAEAALATLESPG